jgi:hypothetical protein
VGRGDYKGSWARSSPDWLVENAHSVGANNPGAVGLFACTDLYNDSQGSDYLWVYKVTIGNSGTFSIRAQQVQGNCGGVSGPGYCVVIGQAAQAGMLFVNQLASFNRPNTDPYLTDASSAALVDYIDPPGPVCVIPPGFSLRLVNNQTQFGFVAWFYYVVKGGTR